MPIGKIYRLSNGEKHYYGSTRQKLEERLRLHLIAANSETRRCSSGELFASLEYKVSIDLMEELHYEDKEQLLWLERWWIENNDCVNKYPPILSEEERNATAKERYLGRHQSEEKYKKYRKQQDEWVKRNRIYSNKKSAEWRSRNKEVLKERRSARVMCECGMEVSKGCFTRHKTRAKHLERMKHL